MTRRVVSVLLGVCMVVGAGNVALGQAYLDRGLGDSGCVEKWVPM